VANRVSTMMEFDPSTRRTTLQAMPVPADSAVSVVSPNGKWVAFESAQSGPTQIWLRNLASGQESLLTGGHCNSSSPAWEADSKAILFASDCGRAFGLPALYRARLEGNVN
jgi:Tol biopolymer transport system component